MDPGCLTLFYNIFVFQASVHSNANKLQDEAVLGAVQRVRTTCAHAKIDATVDLARTILQKEPALVIFSSFAQVAKQVHEKLSSSGWPSELLTGETAQNKRQALVDKFQSGLSSVLVCTFGAGGVGLTLTAASTIILLDRPWTPGEYCHSFMQFNVIAECSRFVHISSFVLRRNKTSRGSDSKDWPNEALHFVLDAIL